MFVISTISELSVVIVHCIRWATQMNSKSSFTIAVILFCASLGYLAPHPETTVSAGNLLTGTSTPFAGWEVSSNGPVNVRSCPGLNCAVLQTVDSGDLLVDPVMHDGWIEFSIDADTRGFVAASLVVQVTLTPFAPTASLSSTPQPTRTPRVTQINITQDNVVPVTAKATLVATATASFRSLQTMTPTATPTIEASGTSTRLMPTRTTSPTQTRNAVNAGSSSGQQTPRPSSTPSRTPWVNSTAAVTSLPPGNTRTHVSPSVASSSGMPSRFWIPTTAALVVLVSLGVGFDRVFSASSASKRLLTKRAKHDFRLARGTQHRSLVEEALSRLETELKSKQQVKERATQNLRKLEANENADLVGAVQDYLVHNRLKEVAGIGPKLSKSIANEIYRGNLSDLRRANQLSGISETKQQAINQWVAKYQRQLKTLAQQQFPGRQAVLDKYKLRRTQLEREIQNASQDCAKIGKELEQLRKQGEPVITVTSEDFVNALTKQSQASDKVDNYIEGVYPPWAAIPDWYDETAKKK